MSFEQQVYEIDDCKEPTPTDQQEYEENNDVFNTLRSQHNRQSYKAFYYPTNKRNEQKDCFNKGGLAVKPLIEIHKTPPW